MIAVSRNNESIPTMEEKRAAVDEIVSSQTLGRSDQLKAFLHFVCESEINGSGAELNEYLIGVQVLGRPEGYSTSDDATVRTRAHARMARKLDPPHPKFNQGLHLRPKLRDVRVGECPGNSTDQTGDAKIVDTAHTSGAPAVHD